MKWLILLLVAQPAFADVRTYALAIGNNSVPVDSDGERLAPLQFADDDAASFISYARDFSRDTFLLTVFDGPSARRFPDLLDAARPPTLTELRIAVDLLKTRFERDEKEGHQPVLLVFYSGHGTRGGAHPPSLAMLDGPLTQEILYRDVLAALPARYVHLLVDACHAEAVVRPRDLDARRVKVSDEDVRAWAARETLDRFPQVGAILATAAGAQAHEWEAYKGGVFTHELLSGLRGAADVNGDGKIEYSELSAYLGAANREVVDARARLTVVVRPPTENRRAPLVDLSAVRGAMRLSGHPAVLGRLTIADDHGDDVAEVHAEPGFAVTMVLPSRPLYVRRGRMEAPVPVGNRASFDELRFVDNTVSARGSVETSMHRGLFATAFGPRYYRGYVEHGDEVLPADPVAVVAPPTPTRVDRTDRNRPAALALFGTGAAATVAAAVLGGMGADAATSFANTSLERPAQNAYNREVALFGAAAATIGVAAITVGVGVWLDVRSRRHKRFTLTLR